MKDIVNLKCAWQLLQSLSSSFLKCANPPWQQYSSTWDLQLNIGSNYKQLLVHFTRNFSYFLTIIVFMPLMHNNQMAFGLANYIKHMLSKILCNMDLTHANSIDWCPWMLACVQDKQSFMNKLLSRVNRCKFYHGKKSPHASRTRFT